MKWEAKFASVVREITAGSDQQDEEVDILWEELERPYFVADVLTEISSARKNGSCVSHMQQQQILQHIGELQYATLDL